MIYRDVELGVMAVADGETIERCSLDIQQRILNLLAFQAPVACDLRIVAALLQWGMFMILVARCLERVGDNAVAVAEQTEFVVTGSFRELAHAAKSA